MGAQSTARIGRDLPPGQHLAREWPVLHYGRVPTFRPQAWRLTVFGAAERETTWSWREFGRLDRVDVVADFHCVTKFSMLDCRWGGVPTRAVLAAAPPRPDVTHVLVWAEYGYSANMRLSDFAADDALLATHAQGEPLAPEHGCPVRLVVPALYGWKGAKWVRGIEYLTADRRGFWEERGYHNRADPWLEQRWTHQESDGDGPPLL